MRVKQAAKIWPHEFWAERELVYVPLFMDKCIKGIEALADLRYIIRKKPSSIICH